MIGYYVHHQGRGHLTRARCIAAKLTEPVTVLSSLPTPDDLGPFADWLLLPPDDQDHTAVDQLAGGALHWAPRRAPGYRQRMARIAEWVDLAVPRLVVVDVSVEVTTFVRLLGTTVVVMAGPGRRPDAAHQLGFQLASRIIAPWPESIYSPAHLQSFASKVRYVGAISRFDDRVAETTSGGRSVVVLFGGGGDAVSASQLDAAREATPDWTWTAFGGSHRPWNDDLWPVLSQAAVVVSHAGQNALAEIAAARRPAILIPQPRPFSEQEETAAALATAKIAVSRGRWPDPDDWELLLTQGAARNGEAWAQWNPGDGAQRAAEAIMTADA